MLYLKKLRIQKFYVSRCRKLLVKNMEKVSKEIKTEKIESL